MQAPVFHGTLFRLYCEILSFARVALVQCNSSAAWACVSLASLLGKMATTLQQRKVQRVGRTIVLSSKNCSDLFEISMATYVCLLDLKLTRFKTHKFGMTVSE